MSYLIKWVSIQKCAYHRRGKIIPILCSYLFCELQRLEREQPTRPLSRQDISTAKTRFYLKYCYLPTIVFLCQHWALQIITFILRAKAVSINSLDLELCSLFTSKPHNYHVKSNFTENKTHHNQDQNPIQFLQKYLKIVKVF